ncbi:hypothetical protein M413DRAFT_423561 [Hebeloma cylindrosporum]|uniref:F-box domain-containing protein n=1 Tax=Hebeloma cylindrosporum TaxID=76867 RepID=A0A0C2XHJ9_HEBCY|nr:hypothetical protein M413DRAFT_423561 [Hebeloma cylindrosporum h7]
MFHHRGYSSTGSYPRKCDHANYFKLETSKAATFSIVNVIKSHSRRLRSLQLDAGANTLKRITDSMDCSQLFRLQIRLEGEKPSGRKFVMRMPKANPTYLTLIKCSSRSIRIGRDNLTNAMVDVLSVNKCIELLRLAPVLEYFHVVKCIETSRNIHVNGFQVLVHLRLRSLNLPISLPKTFLESINLPSLTEWKQHMGSQPIPVAAMLSLLERSRCCLEALTLYGIPPPAEALSDLLQEIPSIERLCLSFDLKWIQDTVLMDNILTRIFHKIPISSADAATPKSFLPHLQIIDCQSYNDEHIPLFSWKPIPEHYREGRRRSLRLKSAAFKRYMTAETALQLIQLVDEGVDLQITDKETGLDFIEECRNLTRKQPHSLVTLARKLITNLK